ncbi:MAG: hypothetical protein IPP90_10530 [Gemmatimonadaceae bacterium]|nr:hypothetical protein [Gemmatimonadaceae bacterium]
MQAAGVPADVLLVPLGDGRMGAGLVNASVDKVFFTGSERTRTINRGLVCPAVRARVAENWAAVTRPLCWKTPISPTRPAASLGAIPNAGQTCVAAKRDRRGARLRRAAAASARGVAGPTITGDTVSPRFRRRPTWVPSSRRHSGR